MITKGLSVKNIVNVLLKKCYFSNGFWISRVDFNLNLFQVFNIEKLFYVCVELCCEAE